MSDNGNSEIGAFLAGFVIGGLVGAATALILAPQSGSETRAQIAAKGEDLRRVGEEQFTDYRARAEEAVSEARSRVETSSEEVQERARIVLDEGKGRVSEALEKGKQQVSEAQEELAENTPLSGEDSDEEGAS